MTSEEEAIKYIEEWLKDEYALNDRDRIVLQMAIKALEDIEKWKTWSHTYDNLISRGDAVSEIHKYYVEEIDKTPTKIDEDGDEVYTDMLTVRSLLACNKELSKRIKSLPSAEQKMGEWIEKSTNGEMFSSCSVCGYVEWDAQRNFCPNCGAKMLREDGEEE